MCEALIFLLDNIYIRVGTNILRYIVGIPMDTNCGPLVADLFLFCYERNFMMSLSEEKQYEDIEAFSLTSRYWDDLLNIDNKYFDILISQIYPSEPQLTQILLKLKPRFWICICFILGGFILCKLYDKRDDFEFEIVNLPYLHGTVPGRASYGVYISQLTRFARMSSHVTDFNTQKKKN